MNAKYAQYLIPALGILCVAGAVAVGLAARAPLKAEFAIDETETYEMRVPEKFEPDNKIPTMEQVVEKHLFVKERKATGQNTFPDLVVKGIYVGDENSAVFALKYRPEANLRVWQGDVDSVISRIIDERDPRKPIVDFLSEWDIKEITFKGVTVEHIITGEVETYLVDYTPAKHVKDNAEAGYGQGQLAIIAEGGNKTASNQNKTSSNAPTTNQERAQVFSQFRNMVQEMSPEQRARLAERIKGGDDRGSRDRNSENNQDRNDPSQNNNSRNNSSKQSSSKNNRSR